MQPMLATPGSLPEGPGWLFEVHWDGLRLLAEITDGAVRLTDRSGRDVTALFPELWDLTRLAPDVVLDGEVVLLDHGVPSFGALAERVHGPVPAARALQARPATFMVSDVLRLYGVSLLERPFTDRRATLERLDLDAVPALSPSPIYSDGGSLWDVTAERGLAGVVAKREDAPYRCGPGAEWVLSMHRPSRLCVVGGWLPDKDRIAALLLGAPTGAGSLRYLGRVGSGLAADGVQRALRDRLVGGDTSPFRSPPVDRSGARWTVPTTVVEVRHGGMTGAGLLRQVVFRGVRDDIAPAGADPSG